MLGVPGQYENVALMLSHEMDSIVVLIGTVFANPVTSIVSDLSYELQLLELTFTILSILH